MFKPDWQKELDAQYAWQRKSKKYKEIYAASLKQLYGSKKNDTDCQDSNSTNGERGADQIRSVVKKPGF